MATLTLTQVATNAALQIGVMDSGEGLSAAQLADALFAVNNQIDNWSDESAMVMSLTITNFALVAATQSYTIGTGQTFNVTRPVAIPAAAYILTVSGNTYQGPIEMLNARQWASLPNRGSTSLVVTKAFYDRGFPTGRIYFSDIPAVTSGVDLTMWTPLTQFADATTPITIQPGYSDLYVLGACISMAPMFQKEVPKAVMARYQDEVARIRALNAQLLNDGPPTGSTSAVATQGEAAIPASA